MSGAGREYGHAPTVNLRKSTCLFKQDLVDGYVYLLLVWFHRSAKITNTAFNGFSCLRKSEVEVEVANVCVLGIGGLPLFSVREGFYGPLDVIHRPVRMSDFLRSSIFIRVV